MSMTIIIYPKYKLVFFFISERWSCQSNILFMEGYVCSFINETLYCHWICDFRRTIPYKIGEILHKIFSFTLI